MEKANRIEKTTLRNQAQLAKLEALQSSAERNKSPHYSFYLILLLIIFNIFDQVSTNLFNQFDDAITMFFAKLGSEAAVWVKFDALGAVTAAGSDYEAYQVLNGKLMLGSTIGFSLLAISPFYKALADKYGRKPFFIINCIGLIISVLISAISYYVFLAANTSAQETFAILLFILGQVIIIFFTIQDIQMIYVFEVVDENKRATVFGLTKGCGLYASVFVIASRLLSIDNVSGLQWQIVFIGVAVFGVISLVTSSVGLRESDAFIRERIKSLRKALSIPPKAEVPVDEKEAGTVAENRQLSFVADAAEQNDTAIESSTENVETSGTGSEFLPANGEEAGNKTPKIGVLQGLKLMLANKQLRMLSIAMLCVSVANNMVCSKANSIMIQSGMSVLYITMALLFAKIIEATLNLVMGWLSDKLGRKPIALVLAACNAVTMTLFCFVASESADMSTNVWSGSAVGGSLFVGITYGVALSSYLCLLDQINLMTSESAPTYLRSSIVGCSSIFRITAVVALVLQSVLAVVAQTPTAWVCYVLSVPFIVAAAIVVFTKVKETKGRTIADVDAEFEQDEGAKEQKQ